MEWAPDKQLAPEADARYRIHKSVKCYVASMQCGTGWCTLYLDNSIERVVHQFPDGTPKILYKNSFYPLHEPSDLEKIVREHLALKGGIHIPGGTIHYNDKNLKFKPFHFINVTSKAEAENYNRLRPIWIASKEFIGENGEGAETIESERWGALSQNQKMQILGLIKAGGEVQLEGLLNRLNTTKLISMKLVDETIVACGAIKSPDDNYRRKIFQKAKSKLNIDDFKLEVGYIVVKGRNRGKGIGANITNSLVQNCNGQGVYATTKSENRKMQTILLSLGFQIEGLPYRPNRGAYSLLLWVKRQT